MARHDGRVAVITGAAQGIGAAIAAVMLEEGARVAVLDISPSALSTARRLYADRGDTVLVKDCDITDEEQLRSTIEQVAAEIGPIDVLVNNAGVSAYFDAAEMSSEEWDSVFAVDLKGLWLASKFVIPGMKSRGTGSIVNIASVHAHVTMRGMFPYAAAKAGVIGLTKSLALDLGPHGIRVNSVSPGYTRTEMMQEWVDRQPDPARALQDVLDVHALGRICDPREIASVVSFLSSDEAAGMTGTEVVVDAGLTARFAS
jgi:NAD(P)-dependent dehydrogenase (short-subunit alcohol dehydrogenase family)